MIPLKIYSLNSLLVEGFVEKAPRKKLVIAFLVECFNSFMAEAVII